MAALKGHLISGETDAKRYLLNHGGGTIFRDIHNVFLGYNSSLLPIVFMYIDCISQTKM